MFNRRELTVQMKKAKKKPDPETISEPEPTFEEKAEAILAFAERIGIKVFAGFCIYIALDTGRQVAVAKSKCPEED